MTEQLNHLQGFSISHEKVYNVLYENLTSRIAYYSVGVVGIMAAVAFVQSYYLTKFINNKKLI